MALFAKATWRGPIPNRTPGGMGDVVGLVLHIEQGSEAGTDNWFHNPGAEASAHFGNPKTGPLDQWVDTADMSWAEVNGNPSWVSVEHEGNSGDSLTDSQLENDAELLVWLHQLYRVPLVVTDNPAGAGLGWHGMGKAAWGGHLDCPGIPIVNARAAIVARANELVGGGEDEVTTPDQIREKIRTYYRDMLGLGPGGRDPDNEAKLEEWVNFYTAHGEEATFTAIYDSDEGHKRRARETFLFEAQLKAAGWKEPAS